MEQLTSDQLSEWEAYDVLDPIGTWRDDFRMAFLSQIITNLAISVHAKKGTKPTEFIDFMPNWSGEEKPEKIQSVEEMKDALLRIFKSAGKKKNTGNQPNQRPPKKKVDG